MPLAALTGATGFLGGRLARQFMQHGWRLRLLVRREIDGPLASAEVVRGDLENQAALTRLTSGADVVVHCAGLIKARTTEEFNAVNAAGAALLAQATQGRMLLVSSLAARAPQLSAYAASKRAGELAAGEILGERLTVIRPPVIYGPGDRETLALFGLAACAPVLPVPAAPEARLTLAHVDDIAAAVVAMAALGAPAGVFALGGDRPTGYSWREIAAAACAAVGRSPAIIGVPGWSLLAAGGLSDVLAPWRAAAPIFTAGKAREMLHGDWRITAAELAPTAPARFSLAEGFADTVAWYRREGWLTN